MRSVDKQLEGYHEPTVVCEECHWANPINALNHEMVVAGTLITASCEKCGNELFDIETGDKASSRLTKAKTAVEYAIDTLDMVSGTVSNVNTDDEVEEIEKKIQHDKSILQDRLKDFQWFRE